ncbi:hypothetical protein WD019_02530, partial [Fictibacillus sp. Mic-4]|uniref:hypothetical protein n=1 Tax=Fictibacillus sp. Mic-4 TaxID=3132826 RepID=UPI003CF485B4
MAFNLTAALRLNDAGFSSGMRKATNSINGMKSASIEVVKQLGLITTASVGIGAAFSSVNK